MRVRPGTTAIVQNEGNTHIQARRSGVQTQTQRSRLRVAHLTLKYAHAAGLGLANHTSNVAERFAFETMTPRTARDAHIVLRPQQLG